MTTRIEYNDVAVKAYAGLHKLIGLRNSIQKSHLTQLGYVDTTDKQLHDSISEIIDTQHELIKNLELVEESVVTS
jgi:hypothetical protein